MDVKLKPDTDIIALLHVIKKCQQDILFISREKDQLNLKSQLSSYVFIDGMLNVSLLEKGYLRVTDPGDLDLLAPFLQNNQRFFAETKKTQNP